jgi:hypothetical protein
LKDKNSICDGIMWKKILSSHNLLVLKVKRKNATCQKLCPKSCETINWKQNKVPLKLR